MAELFSPIELSLHRMSVVELTAALAEQRADAARLRAIAWRLWFRNRIAIGVLLVVFMAGSSAGYVILGTWLGYGSAVSITVGTVNFYLVAWFFHTHPTVREIGTRWPEEEHYARSKLRLAKRLIKQIRRLLASGGARHLPEGPSRELHN